MGARNLTPPGNFGLAEGVAGSVLVGDELDEGDALDEADALDEIELPDEAGGATLDCWGRFRCRINQITTAAPSTINRIALMGRVFCFGVCPDSIIGRVQCWCAEIYRIPAGYATLSKEKVRFYAGQIRNSRSYGWSVTPSKRIPLS